jgi:protein arginine N-methyltransferase 1
VDGLLLWIELRCLPGAVPVNSLTMRTNWMPVYLPLFDPPREAGPGEEMHIGFRYRLSDDGVHPDYFVTARLAGATAEFPVPYRPGTFGAHPVYRRLFPAT